MELWAVVVGDQVMEVGLIRSNVQKEMKKHRKEAPKWLETSLERLDIISESEVLINFVVDKLLH